MHHRVQRLLAVTVAVLAVSSTLGASVASSSDPCRGLETMTMPDGSVLCTHGDDDHLGAHVAADGTTLTPLRRAAAQCYSDGLDGYRVSVLYVHAEGAPNRLASVQADIRRDVEQVEAMIVDSAASQGGQRYVRWETEATGAGCRPRVQSVAVPRSDLDDVMSTVTALAERGYGRTDRRYALYVDDDSYCGIATMPRDRQAGPSNVANRRAGYARVDRPCWNRGDRGAYATMGHELVHSLGAVQPEAPNSTPGGHCTDEWDPLCYDDGTGDASHVRCRAQDGGHRDDHQRQLDCGADDYFSIAPAAGSYLADNWNTADSPYLATAPGYGAGGGAGSAAGSDVRWPAGRGTFRPSSSVGGFEACDLPLQVAPAGKRSGNLLGNSTTGDAAITSVTRSTIDRVNSLAGMTVLELADPTAQVEPAAGTVLVGRTSGPDSEVTVWTAGDQTSRARVRLPGSQPTVDVALPAVLDALGVGSVPFGDRATGRLGGADARGTTTALRHLYGSGCSQQPRLDVNAAGHPSQLAARAERRSVDLGSATNAVDLGVEVSRWLRAGAGEAPRAVVCRDDVPADCLAGAGLLTRGGPLAFVPGGRGGKLPRAVSDELRRAVAADGTVTVLGGPDAVAPRVVEQLRAALPGRRIERVFGGTRYDTAAAVARRVAPRGADRVLVARGDDPADAVVAAALAARDGLPVVLTAPGRLSDPAATYLRNTQSPLAVLLGGPHALTSQVASDVAGITRAVRVAGNTRTGTAVSIARSGHLWGRTTAGTSAAVVGVPGYGPHAWQAALAAAPVAARLDAPVTYLAPDRVPHSDGGSYDTAEYVAGLPVRGASRVAATSVVVGARLGGLDDEVPATFHALFLPALRDRVELVAE